MQQSHPASGGCINSSIIVSSQEQNYFVKYHDRSGFHNFQCEYSALKELEKTQTIKIPQPIACEETEDFAVLVLEALTLNSSINSDWAALGKQLAILHKVSGDAFGWKENNYIGSTPQSNKCYPIWAHFFKEERLRPQLELAKKNGFTFEGAERLLEKVDELLANHSPLPSLLHGDLWSGNVDFLPNGEPVIFDPAIYYGDREADLAFSEFFGGFPPEFYKAYNLEWPLPPEYQKRKMLYNLYHALNHTNLFGSGYAIQSQRMILSLLES